MAKVIDFGFISWSSDAKDRVTLPRSWPWYAPECDEYPQLTPLEGQKADVYSFGMLCLWFLFERFFSGLLTHLDPFKGRVAYSRAIEGASSTLEILACLKSHQLLPQLALELVSGDHSLQAQSKQMMQQFFEGSLVDNLAMRHPNMQAALAHLNIEE